MHSTNIVDNYLQSSTKQDVSQVNNIIKPVMTHGCWIYTYRQKTW